MERYPIKPKLDWLHAKFSELQRSGPPGLPNNACFMVTAIYDLLRTQRNELGHPRDNHERLHQALGYRGPRQVFEGSDAGCQASAREKRRGADRELAAQ
jgi:hypothetical protein